MKPVMQTITDDAIGNCFQACLASILELSIEAVPEFRRMQVESSTVCMEMEADKWLRENHRLRLISIEMYDPKGSPLTTQCLLNRQWTRNKEDFVMLSGESPRKSKEGKRKYHSVVGVADCWGFKVVHDPHPDGGGIIGQPYGVKWLVPLKIDFQSIVENSNRAAESFKKSSMVTREQMQQPFTV